MTADFIRMDAWDDEARAARSSSVDDRPVPADDDGPLWPPLEAYAGEPEHYAVDPAPSREQPTTGFIRPEAASRVRELKSALLPLNELEAILERQYLVKGWPDLGAASVVYAPSNIGKTFFAIDLALYVAAGVDWHGNRVRNDGGAGSPVVYIAAEGGIGVRNRLVAFRREHPEVYARAAQGGFFLLPLSIDLCGGADADDLIKALGNLELRPALIVVDTLARSMGGGDENSAQDMGIFVASLDRVRAETGAHAMAIHHSGKDAGRGARGSSSLRGAVDTEIALSLEGIVITAKTEKQRDMPRDGTFAYTLQSVELGVDEDGDKVTSCVIDPVEPSPKRPRVSGQQGIALDALNDAIADRGQTMGSDSFPTNREVVALKLWRQYCDRHSLSEGTSESATRKAFSTAKSALHKKGVIEIIDDHVWIC